MVYHLQSVPDLIFHIILTNSVGVPLGEKHFLKHIVVEIVNQQQIGGFLGRASYWKFLLNLHYVAGSDIS